MMLSIITDRIQSLFPECKVESLPFREGHLFTVSQARGKEWYKSILDVGIEADDSEIEEGILKFTKETREELAIRGLKR